MNAKLRVLFFDDDPNDAMLVARALRDVAKVDIAIKSENFIELLKEDWDAILLDWRVQGMTGEEAVETARQKHADVPLILVTGSIDDEAAASALRLGFVDYLRKDRLERLAHAVTEAHKNADLRKRAMRDQRHEIMGTLAAGLAHDMRNILGSIVMGIGVLREKLNKSDTHILDAMHRAANKGTDMVAQMMTFSKGSNGTSFKNVTAEFLLGEVAGMIRYQTSSSNIRLSVRTDVGTWSVKCDPTQINTVLVNMCINAVQEMTPHGGELFLEARNTVLHDLPLEGNYVCFSIRDTGGGIPDDVLPKIFDAYFSTKGNKGTGLGLAFVKTILESHDGAVGVNTSPHGTTFQIFLPAYRSEPEIQKENFDGKGAVVVLVDDEEMFRSTVALLLESANYKVLPACNGPEAMSFFRSTDKVSALVSDLAMPLMCGRELSRHLREQGFNVPTVFITGREFEEKIEPEPDAMLHKPFTREELLSTLRRLIDASSGQVADNTQPK